MGIKKLCITIFIVYCILSLIFVVNDHAKRTPYNWSNRYYNGSDWDEKTIVISNKNQFIHYHYYRDRDHKLLKDEVHGKYVVKDSEFTFDMSGKLYIFKIKGNNMAKKSGDEGMADVYKSNEVEFRQ